MGQSRPSATLLRRAGFAQTRAFYGTVLRQTRRQAYVGVGAAFDIHTGGVKEAPKWLKSLGLQWLHRLIKEPNRLWRRYLACVPSFIWNIGLQLLGIRKFSIDT